MNIPTEKFHISSEHPVRTSLEKVSLIIGVIGIIATVAGYFADSHRFFFSYLTAFAFWATLALGGLFFTMLHHLTGATWSVVIRRISETIMSILPIMAIFFIPILLGMQNLYHWTSPEAVTGDHLLEHKESYLNIPFFLIRTIGYFVVWTLLAVLLYRTSLKEDDGHTPALAEKMKKISAPGMVVFALSVTYAAFDWFMSQDPHWYSTMFGVYIFSGGLVSILAFLAYLSLSLRKKNVLTDIISEEHYHDLGKLMFAFMVFWAYVAFSQYFLIWYANIPEETIWFDHRYQGIWKYVTLLIAYGYFVVPFLILIVRGAKRKLGFLKIMAGWLLLMHWVDLNWIIVPSMGDHASWISWIDIASMAGIGGIFMWLFWKRLFANALVPINDPRLGSSIKFINQ